MRLWRWGRGGRDFEREMGEELRFHVERQAAENVAAGMTADEARRQAVLQFGGVEGVKETCRSERRGHWFETVLQDVRYGVRMLRKSPGFTVVAVLTLALGIGANTAMFSVVNAVFLRPFPFPAANRIYVVDRVGAVYGGPSIPMPVFLAWRRQKTLFDALALVQYDGDVTLTGTGTAERVPAAGVSVGFFSLMGLHAALGRIFLPQEGRLGGAQVVMLSNELWRRRFGGDPGVIGRAITLDGASSTIVGVFPEGFNLPFPWLPQSGFWFPVQVPDASQNAGNGINLCLGRLKSGVSGAQAEAALTVPLRALRAEFPAMFTAAERAHLEPLREFVRGSAGPAPLLLLGAVALVLLIACANVASLTLTRSSTRRREMAVRAALGAAPARILRQLLTESILLSLFAGACGILACYGSFGAIVSLVPGDIPRVGAFRIDFHVLLFAVLLSIFTGAISGVAPAIRSARARVPDYLREADAHLTSRRTAQLRSGLVVCELAVSVVLAIGAALAIESLGSLLRVQPGFDPKGVLTFNISLPMQQYDTGQKQIAFFRQSLSRLSALPGVERAAIADFLPLTGESTNLLVAIEGMSTSAAKRMARSTEIETVSADYFGALGVPVRAGRVFAESDDSTSIPSAVISQTMGKALWPDQNPIGRRIWIGKPMGGAFAEPAPREIVGVVGDVRYGGLASRPSFVVYIPFSQTQGIDSAYFLLRTSRAPLLSVSAARGALDEVNPNLPLAEIRTMNQIASDSLGGWRFRAILLGAFGALGLFIAAIGIYGVISYTTTQRSHEIGIRMALGAQPRQVMRLVMGQGARLAVAGVTIGIAAAAGLTRYLASQLYGVKATDPVTFAGVAALLLIVALGACYIPARRAMRVDPMVALRHE